MTKEYRFQVPVASELVETAMHCIKGGTSGTVNWVNTHRLASLSYWTMGSPSLRFSQSPPKPCQRVLPANGPAIRCPSTLLSTTNDRLTHCTNCVAPTAPLVSGGTVGGIKPKTPWPSPSKFRVGVASKFIPAKGCTTESSCGLSRDCTVGTRG